VTLAPVNLGHVVQGTALSLPVRPASVSLVVTSPPYWALRVYEDAEEVYDGQLGSEADPVLFLRNLWHAADEAWDALRDDGAMWVNLGDKYAGSGGHNNSNLAKATHERDGVSAKLAEARSAARTGTHPPVATRASRARGKRRQSPDRYEQGTEWARAKSLMGLPWAYVMGLTVPALYRNHLDPVPRLPCPDACDNGTRDRMATPDEVDDGCELGVFFDACPTCDGAGTVPGSHPQWVWRAEQVWDKPNNIPESVKDRPRRTHEVWFLLTKNGRYFGTTDELREAYNPNAHDPGEKAYGPGTYPTWGVDGSNSLTFEEGTRTPPDSRGKPPGSVWSIAAEPFTTKLYHLDDEGGRVVDADELALLQRGRGPAPAVDPGPLGLVEGHAERAPLRPVREAEHFAPFPSEWPRRLVLGWSPSGICTVCDTGRFPVVERRLHQLRDAYDAGRPGRHDATSDGMSDNGFQGTGKVVAVTEATILGYACECTPRTDNGPAGEAWSKDRKNRAGSGTQAEFVARPPRYLYHFDGWEAPPTRPALVLDMFSGTATTAAVAAALGRVGVGVDLSWDYCRLGQWRTRSGRLRDRARRRTAEEAQDALLFPEPMATHALAVDVAHSTPAHARTGDPDTSKRAALNVMPRTGTHRAKVLAALYANRGRGLTGDDLCALLGDANGSSWRSRLAECADPERYNPPLVEPLGTERVTRSGEMARVFVLTDVGTKVALDLAES
jgi:hypothetical protein